jgi:hypothetical protein
MNDKTPKQSRGRNALVHGLYAKDVLLPWDSRDEFERLHEDLKAEFSPHGRAEEEAVLDLANLHWQKHTLWRMRQVAVLSDPFTADILQCDCQSWSDIRKRLRSAANDERTLLGALEAQNAKLFTTVKRLRKEMDATSDPEEAKLIEDKMNALFRTVSDHVLPLLEKLRQGPNAEQAFDKAYAPETIEKILRLEAAIDARIAKVLARLVGLKEFKRTPAAGTPAMAIPSLPNR